MAKEKSTVTISALGKSVTLTGEQFSKAADDAAKVVEPKADMFGYVRQQIYTAVVDVDGEKETLFTRAPTFEDAKRKFEKTPYVLDHYGEFIKIAEVNGKWVE